MSGLERFSYQESHEFCQIASSFSVLTPLSLEQLQNSCRELIERPAHGKARLRL